MASLMEMSIDKEDPLKSVAGYEPEKVTLDENTDTVEGRVRKIIQDDSPLMQLAKTQSKQEQARSGRLNSTMADTAGQTAVIQTATPIASQDAGQSVQNKQFNATQGNQGGQFNASQKNQAESQIEAGNQSMREIEARTGAEKVIIDYNKQAEMALQSMRGEQAIELEKIQNANQQLLQKSQSAAALYSQYALGISEILAQPDLNEAAKQSQVNKMKEVLQSGLAFISSVENSAALADIGELLDFSGSVT